MPREIIPVRNFLEKLYTDGVFSDYKLEITELAWEIGVHAFGLFPSRLISERRPNEPDQVLEYRCSIYEPITKKYIGKVITELNKIRRSTDWALLFDRNDVPAKLLNNSQDLTLENYLMFNFPEFTSLTNWLFSLVLPTYLIDANAFIIVLPKDVQNIQTNELIEPTPEIIPSNRIKYYIPGEVFVFLDEYKCSYTVYDEDMEPRIMPGDIVYIVTPNSYARYDQVSDDYRLKEIFNYSHNLGYIPVTQTGGLVKGKVGNRIVYRSRIADMIPDLNEAVREYSDIQAEAVNVIYSERWEMGLNDCETCSGTGEIINPGLVGNCEPCKKCKGTGQVPRSPYSKLVIKQDMAGESGNFPIPPAGYIEKDTKIIDIQDRRIQQHINDALGAINMSFLEDVPLSESGESKKVDRDALNTFVHSIAEDLVRIADVTAKFINDLRYSYIVPDKDTRDKMLPDIVVPESFDMLSADYLLKELAAAQSSNVSPVIINALQKEYASKKFNANADVRKELELTLKLDPLSGITDDDKLTRLSARGISQQSYIISSNITDFIARALFDYKDAFYSYPLDKQKEILNSYANEVIITQTNNLVPPNEV